MDNDERYLAIVRDAVAVCLRYKPKFGKGGKDGLTLSDSNSSISPIPSTVGSAWIRRLSMLRTRLPAESLPFTDK